jgi:hypothetical protein
LQPVQSSRIPVSRLRDGQLGTSGQSAEFAITIARPAALPKNLTSIAPTASNTLWDNLTPERCSWPVEKLICPGMRQSTRGQPVKLICHLMHPRRRQADRRRVLFVERAKSNVKDLLVQVLAKDVSRLVLSASRRAFMSEGQRE